MSQYQYLVFDLDNTIFDFTASEQVALRRIFEEDGVEYNDETVACYREFNKGLWEQYEQGVISQTTLNEERFARFFAHYGKDVSGKVSDRKFREYIAQANVMMPDAIAIIRALKPHYTMMAATNGIEEMQLMRLEQAGLEGFFDYLYISDVVGDRKPSVEFFQTVIDKTPGMTKENALMIGDSFKADIYGASRVGMDTCWYMENPVRPEEPEELLTVEPTYQITHLEQLLPILEEGAV